MNLIQSNELAAFQRVPHIHVHGHVIPRYKGDEISRILKALLHEPHEQHPSIRELNEVAYVIRQHLMP